MEQHRFYQCRHCDTLVGMIHSSGEPLYCCGEPMRELIPNTTDGASEKHLPVVKQDGAEILVSVGSLFHPMTQEHSIQWVYLQTGLGGQRKNLTPDTEPVTRFCLTKEDHPVAVYAYCNLHGLWRTDL